MTHPERRRPEPGPPIDPPPLFVERRQRFRRESDRVAHEETRLLARALDVLAADRPPEARLAGLLDLLADTVGADRAAVVADGPQRRVAVAATGVDDEPAATDLASWLGAAAPRTRARRAAAPPAEVSILARDARARRRRRSAARPIFALLPIPAGGEVTLGFAFAQPIDEAELASRLPPALARHAAVALSLVTHAISTERELATLRAGETERQRFVSTVAHELRTPLTGLSGYLDLILDGRVGDADIEREFLERGRTIVTSMAALVGDLLELSKLESGTLMLESEPFSVADAIQTVASGVMPIALGRGARLQASGPPRLRSAVGDRRRVEQILTNLTANALKFGGDDTTIELTGRFEGSTAILVVRDEGPGIAPDDAQRIFERFYRMEGHQRVTGTGLGLPIARDLARAMAGELDVASLPGVGSSFVLVLPGPPGPADPARIATVMAAALEAEAERLYTIATLRSAGRDNPDAVHAPG